MTKKQLRDALKDKQSIIQAALWKYNLTTKPTPPTANEFILLKAYCQVLLRDMYKEQAEKQRLRLKLGDDVNTSGPYSFAKTLIYSVKEDLINHGIYTDAILGVGKSNS